MRLANALTTLTTLFSRIASITKKDVPGFPALRGIVPILALASLLTALALAWLFYDNASYKPLFGTEEGIVVADAVGVLDAERVPYRLHPETGRILVPDTQIAKARMALAAKGVVAQMPAGLELVDRDERLGVRQFVQDVRFRRGMEGELARSIMSLTAVSSARVHLSLAPRTSFVFNDGAPSSASVLLTLKPGQSLNKAQIVAVIKLVAGSVSNLAPERVTLVDQYGNPLSSHVDLDDTTGGAHSEATQRFRDAALDNVRSLLSGTLGAGNFKASVTVDVDDDIVAQTNEQFGEAPRVTNEAMREERGGDALAIGVPGSLSHRPVDAAAPSVTPAGDTARKTAATRQFSYDRSITQIKRARGRLKQMHVAVIVNAAAAPDVSTGWTPVQLADMERVLRAGLGIQSERGDTLVVSAMSFPSSSTGHTAPWWQSREAVFEMAGYGVGGLGLLIAVLTALWFVRQRQRKAKSAVSLADTSQAYVAASSVGQAMSSNMTADHNDSGLPLLAGVDLPSPDAGINAQIEHLKKLAESEPARVAEVVKQWVQKNDAKIA